MDLLRRPLLSEGKYQYSVLNSSSEALSPSCGQQAMTAADMDDFEYADKQLHRGFCSRCFANCMRFFRKKEQSGRTVWVGRRFTSQVFPKNIICNQKYNIFTFVPGVLYNQFKFFLNLYFLVMACSQFVPSLRIGDLYTYWLPLGLVLTVTLLREAYDEIKCHKRDREINSAKYSRMNADGTTSTISSADIQVSDVIVVEKNQRVPADLVMLRTSEKNGTCFIRTDQMDGETDWKLRVAVSHTQALRSHHDVITANLRVYAEPPHTDIHLFVGTFQKNSTYGGGGGESNGENGSEFTEESLNIENTAWANTVIASGSIVGVVVYTGEDTRSSMNTSQPATKSGLLDDEINTLTKILFVAVLILSFILISVKGFDGPWYRYMFRFVILFSYIIPIALRVNLDMGKAVYTYLIQTDKKIPDTLVRTSTLAEELGRIDYLLCDKTGTLTQNDMVFKRLHMGTVSYSADTMDEVAESLSQSFSHKRPTKAGGAASSVGGLLPNMGSMSGDYKMRRSMKTQDSVKALAICHNVTPVYDDKDDEYDVINLDDEVLYSKGAEFELRRRRKSSDDSGATPGGGAATPGSKKRTYQASSPDEVALVKWTESVGLTLVQRDVDAMRLETCHGHHIDYKILQVFPFTSESKRMGIIVQEVETEEIIFYVKGADSVMMSIVAYNDWLSEECDNMARDGLRTLVVAQKVLSRQSYRDFESRYNKAKCEMVDRQVKVASEIESLERNMELLCLTGVEDRLQLNVKPTLEMLSNAGIKIWMLTGDKLETSICIAKSARLVHRDQEIHVFRPVTSRTDAHLELNAFRRKRAAHHDATLVIRGSSLAHCLRHYADEFVELACQASAVVICRCSPTQKAQIVKLLRGCKMARSKRVCAIGDGGNDVSMIQAAHCGIGIVGKEGRQASLASDFSIAQFSFIGQLLMVHGRDSYKRSASLSQFIIHRGLIISIMQAIFSSVFYFSSVSLYQGILMVGYTTVFTMLPVFSLVLDKDVKSDVALRFPELYRDLKKGRSLSFKTFLLWILISIYQGGAIMYGALLLFDRDFTHIVSISFTSVVITQLVMVVLTIRTMHWLMLVSEGISILIFFSSLFLLHDYFDSDFLASTEFLWKTAIITTISCLPLALLKYVRKRFSPPIYSKLDE